MKRLWLLLALLPVLGCDQAKVAELQKQNADYQKQNQQLAAKLDALTARLDAQAKTATLDLQGKCAKQAELIFHQQGFDRDKQTFASYTNHYQEKLDKCFVEINSLMRKDNIPSTAAQVLDAFEGKLYGDYFWTNPQGKKYWQVKPYMCRVVTPSGEEKGCESRIEFDALMEVYMEN